MKPFGKLDPRALLESPAAYGMHSRLAAPHARKRDFVDRFLRPGASDRVLDIGCGTAALLPHLPAGVTYVGFDLSERYIEDARRIHGSRGAFHHRALTAEAAREFEPFDLVMAIGVLHHLDDREAELLFRVAHEALKPGGRLVTCDGAFVPGQNPIARLLLKMDRGRYVRPPAAYEAIGRRVFSGIEHSVHHDLNSFPYTHCVMTGTRT
ncbi:methyltransferase family protein [Pseudaminobacter salicylatoxidans]|uniref:Methyltransferase family protein n=1 Tax=Pseudaminobacter salicylatoxidans TaxID=93369 RepID=A0A316C5C3_PSESE|nr:class I SAM-dependent methyltransferase [Pseudaminobacter salicylatoxidans]PWJ85022.1 methyltransferase family protein [Pseudaminobacter salicylatoxidans]